MTHPIHPTEDGCLDPEVARMSRLWHGAFCRWYDHREAGHLVRASVWAVATDVLARVA